MGAATLRDLDPVAYTAACVKLHPGESRLEYRERIGHVPSDPTTWGPIDEDPEANLLGVVFANPPCGCRVVGNGTLPYPLTILRCGACTRDELLSTTLTDAERALIAGVRLAAIKPSVDARTLIIRKLVSLLDRISPPPTGPTLVLRPDLDAYELVEEGCVAGANDADTVRFGADDADGEE